MKVFVCGKLGIVLCSLAVLFFSTLPGMAADVDHLLITGFVRSVDKSAGTISVDVTTLGCRGVRAFRVPPGAVEDLSSSLIGRRLQFNIDSATCKSGFVYNIVNKEQP